MSSGLMRSNRRQTRKVVLSDGCGQHWDLTESRSSMTRWGLDAEDGLVPLSLLNCVNKMFMVARSTSERLCLICRERHNEERRKCPGIKDQLGERGPVLQEGRATPYPHSCQLVYYTPTKKVRAALERQVWKQSPGNAVQKVRSIILLFFKIFIWLHWILVAALEVF